MNTAGINLQDHDSCYRALIARDRRFDGIFFVGVSTTGIYCRPICPAKTPKQDRCTFYPSAAAAERAGFRPCLRCRPELAPGSARVDAVSRLASVVASRIEETGLADQSLAELATELGVSDRHLRRAVEMEFGASPVQLAQTQRLLLAKRLLTDTRLTATEVAFASGFASLRRFNALFKERYRMCPTDLRKRRGRDTGQGVMFFEMAYRPPLDWASLLSFLAARATCGVEIIEENRYSRTVSLGGHAGWITAEPAPSRHVLRIEVSTALAPVIRSVISRVKRLFDLSADPCRIAAALGELAETGPGLRVPGAFDGFSLAVRAILGQQVSVKAASTLAGRFASAFGAKIETPYSGLTYLEPSTHDIAQTKVQELATIGVMPPRAGAIVELARAVEEKTLRLEPGGDIPDTIARLKSLPGIGEWTAQYIAMRALGWPDAFPHSDLGILRALGETSPKRVLEIAEAWRPWRSYAAMHLWKRLEEGR
jgi:AraC family transcriptional regulator of adaptative response / DNA-3-methyladenine glycosylase II